MPDDVITPTTPHDEETRIGTGEQGPQNYRPEPSAGGVAIATDRASAGFYNHMSAVEIRALVGGEVWDSYSKFCVERSPWERVISLYFWRNQRERRPSIADFLDSEVPEDLRSRGWDLHTIDDEIAVDRLLRYEALPKEIEEVRLRLGLPEPLELPGAKPQFRHDRRPAGEILTDAEKRTIAAMFDHGIRLMDYRFPCSVDSAGRACRSPAVRFTHFAPDNLPRLSPPT